MTLSDCCVRRIPIEAFPLSKDIVSYEDNFWDNILNSNPETSSTKDDKLLRVSCFEDGSKYYNYSDIIDNDDKDDQIDILSDKYIEQFEPQPYNSTKTLLPEATITTSSSKQKIVIYSSFSIDKNLRSKGAQTHITKKTIRKHPSRNPISNFLRRQKRHRYPKNSSNYPEDSVRLGMFTGTYDIRHMLCPLMKSNSSKSTCYIRKCVCQSLSIRPSPLRKQMSR